MVFEMTPRTSPRPNDCGATCMQMFLSYYGIEVDLETLIKDCNTSITGSTGRDLMDCGRKYGLDMRCFQEVDPDSTGHEGKELYGDILNQDRPAIIWWMYNHWVMFGGVNDAGKVVIYNPDRGRYSISKGTFKSFYTNISITNGIPEDLPDEV